MKPVLGPAYNDGSDNVLRWPRRRVCKQLIDCGYINSNMHWLVRSSHALLHQSSTINDYGQVPRQVRWTYGWAQRKNAFCFGSVPKYHGDQSRDQELLEVVYTVHRLVMFVTLSLNRLLRQFCYHDDAPMARLGQTVCSKSVHYLMLYNTSPGQSYSSSGSAINCSRDLTDIATK